MKGIAILALAAVLEAGFLLTAALPVPVLKRAETNVKDKAVMLVRLLRSGAPVSPKS
ncbi:MAG TPA: hypothetical protein VFG53_10455 [Anaeromyxobacter sp.]|nr:hypothetical protein [Anaeromyxobacter sp.]